MDTRAVIRAKLAEFDLDVSEEDLDELVPAYENLLRQQKLVEAMLESRPLTEGMEMPLSEPILVHNIARYR